MIAVLCWTLFALLVGWMFIKATVKALRKVDVDVKVEERKQKEAIFEKHSGVFSKEANKKAKSISDSLNDVTELKY